MCAVLWWVALFGNKSTSYQTSKNFKRDFRIICNEKKGVFPQCAGEKVDHYLMKNIGLDEDKYADLRERALVARNNFFAHVNPDKTVLAEDLHSHERMFGDCMELVIEFLSSVSNKFPSLKHECDKSIKAIQENNAKVAKDYGQFFEIFNHP